MKNAKPTHDLIDAKTGKVVHEGGKKLSARQAKKLAEDGLTHLLAVDEDLYGMYRRRGPDQPARPARSTSRPATRSTRSCSRS